VRGLRNFERQQQSIAGRPSPGQQAGKACLGTQLPRTVYSMRTHRRCSACPSSGASHNMKWHRAAAGQHLTRRGTHASQVGTAAPVLAARCQQRERTSRLAGRSCPAQTEGTSHSLQSKTRCCLLPLARKQCRGCSRAQHRGSSRRLAGHSRCPAGEGGRRRGEASGHGCAGWCITSSPG